MKTWFITGAARGLGLEIARAALDTGDQVIATARDPDHILLALPSYGDRLHVVRLDITHDTTEGIAADAARYFGGVDVLVNNAGYGQLGAFEEVTRQSVEKQFATNVFGVFDVSARGLWLCMRAEIRQMLKQGRGTIVNMGSMSSVVGIGGLSTYTASKHAVLGLTRGAALDYAKQGIRINAVGPGTIDTPMIERFIELSGSDSVMDPIRAAHPVGRTGRASEVAEAVLWLASDASSFVVGHMLMVDGGYSVR